MINKENIVEIENLSIHYKMKNCTLKAINNVSLNIKKGKITALVGESGCGKTTLSTGIINCITSPGEIVAGEIKFFDDDEVINVEKLNAKEINAFRWEKVSMVFQGAQSSLNPLMTIEKQFMETMRVHRKKITKQEMLDKIYEVLKIVNLDADRILKMYPHELSGGMKQRVMIAFSLLLDPKLIILDEPTTALDVITQDYIFSILLKINREMNISMLLLTHDIGVVANYSDYVAVMYAGQVMEYGPVEEIFDDKIHPYTRGLINSTPSLIADLNTMKSIEGMPPNLLNLPTGCPFNPRCKRKNEICEKENPCLSNINNEHYFRCHLKLEDLRNEGNN